MVSINHVMVASRNLMVSSSNLMVASSNLMVASSNLVNSCFVIITENSKFKGLWDNVSCFNADLNLSKDFVIITDYLLTVFEILIDKIKIKNRKNTH